MRKMRTRTSPNMNTFYAEAFCWSKEKAEALCWSKKKAPNQSYGYHVDISATSNSFIPFYLLLYRRSMLFFIILRLFLLLFTSYLYYHQSSSKPFFLLFHSLKVVKVLKFNFKRFSHIACETKPLMVLQ